MLQFDGVARKLVYDFKYHHVRILAQFLAQFLADYFRTSRLPADILIPVPLHPRRLRERGYNQSGLLAQELAHLILLPLDDTTLVRSINTPAQARTANIRARQENVAGAFVCQNNSLKDKHVLLIDDVCTTGATLNACAVALKNMDAASVWGLTVAREL